MKKQTGQLLAKIAKHIQTSDFTAEEHQQWLDLVCKLQSIELTLTRGGYILDCENIPVKAGDLIQILVMEPLIHGPVYCNTTLLWDKEQFCFYYLEDDLKKQINAGMKFKKLKEQSSAPLEF